MSQPIPGMTLQSGTFTREYVDGTIAIDGAGTVGPIHQTYAENGALGAAMLGVESAFLAGVLADLPDLPVIEAKLANVASIVQQAQAVLTDETDPTQRARWTTVLNALTAAVS